LKFHTAHINITDAVMNALKKIASEPKNKLSITNVATPSATARPYEAYMAPKK